MIRSARLRIVPLQRIDLITQNAPDAISIFESGAGKGPMPGVFYFKVCHLWKCTIRILDADKLLLGAPEIAKAYGLTIDRRVFRTNDSAVGSSVRGGRR